MRSSGSALTISVAASLARARRLGARSFAIMLREVSIAMIRFRESERVSTSLYPNWGRLMATKSANRAVIRSKKTTQRCGRPLPLISCPANFGETRPGRVRLARQWDHMRSPKRGTINSPPQSQAGDAKVRSVMDIVSKKFPLLQ